ncbi:MAG TPA: hypothetical protein VGZ03_04895, partial [Acidimicrobiales bacterium]|nr:hypothetical protein [Acidimicrobiales bacterium]
MSADAEVLRDEIALLTRSLDDARAEHARGELDDASLAGIEQRDGARLAEATAALDALGPTTDPAPGPDARGDAPRHRPRWLLVVAATCLVLAIGVVALAVADPFGTAPPAGSTTTRGRVHALLLYAEVLVASKHPLRALTAFDAVLRLAPTNPEALVESGWLRYEVLGLGHRHADQVALGAAAVHRAVRLAPHDAAAHIYWAVVLYQHDHAPAA